MLAESSFLDPLSPAFADLIVISRLGFVFYSSAYGTGQEVIPPTTVGRRQILSRRSKVNGNELTVGKVEDYGTTKGKSQMLLENRLLAGSRDLFTLVSLGSFQIQGYRIPA